MQDLVTSSKVAISKDAVGEEVVAAEPSLESAEAPEAPLVQ